jgi:hypothetical protein
MFCQSRIIKNIGGELLKLCLCFYMNLANSFYGSSPLWLLHHKIGPKTILVINQCSIGDIATYSHHHSRIHVLAQV